MMSRKFALAGALAGLLLVAPAAADSHHASPPPASHPAGPHGHGTYHGSYGHRGYYHGGPSVRLWWGLGWWPWWDAGYWGYPYNYGYGPYRPWGYTVGYPNDSTGGRGALDMDVSPERAEVYVDGEYLGVCDDFDGFPDYLWLPKGTYDLVIYLSGYKTIARQVDIVPGLVIDVNDEMVKGESVRPEDLPSKSHVHRDERLEQEREVQQDLARRQAGLPPPEVAPPEEVAPPGSIDFRQDPAKLRLEVTPDDASVYLDGRFLGSARELARLHAGLLIDPGAHTLDVVRPGYADAQRSFTATSGQETTIQVTLERR